MICQMESKGDDHGSIRVDQTANINVDCFIDYAHEIGHGYNTVMQKCIHERWENNMP
jgi:hypothetical protein